MANKALDTINLLLFVGSGLYSWWYYNNSIQVYPDEREYVKALVKYGVRMGVRPDIGKRVLQKI